MTLALDPRPLVRSREEMPMLLYEALARSRQREAEEAARRYRLARSLVAGRRWAWLAAFASRRAARAAWRRPRGGRSCPRAEAASAEWRRDGAPALSWPGRPTRRPRQLASTSKIHGSHRWTIERSGTSASSWQSTPSVPIVTRCTSRYCGGRLSSRPVRKWGLRRSPTRSA